MRRIAWVTGRAAAGKSTVIAACVARLRAESREPLVLQERLPPHRVVQAGGGDHLTPGRPVGLEHDPQQRPVERWRVEPGELEVQQRMAAVGGGKDVSGVGVAVVEFPSQSFDDLDEQRRQGGRGRLG